MAITTMADIARTHGAERPDKPVIHFEGRTITYGDLDRRSSQVANGLRAAGVGEQERVAYLDGNNPDFFDLLFGSAKLNAVLVSVNWRLAPPEIAQIINDAQAKVLFVGSAYLPAIDKVRDELTTVTTFVTLGEGGDYESWLAAQDATDPGVRAAGDDVAIQLYTSGTTGLPKGVMLTNDNFFGMLGTASDAWRFSEDSVNILVMPLFHIAGSGWGVVGMYKGCSAVMLPDVDPKRILEVIPEFGVTNAFFVPAVLQFMLATPGVEKCDFSTLHTIAYGASPITDKVLTQAMDVFGAGFMQVYGLTETTGAVTMLGVDDHDPDNRPELLRSCGKPMAGTTLRIVDPETLEDVPEGEVGEVWINSPQNMKGYWRNEAETTKALTPDNWFRSGDAGFLKDGFLFLHDRVKDMIVSGGENIYPAEIENVLMTHPAVADVAVIGVPDEKWGEAVKAVVVPAAGAEVTAEELVAFSKERLASYKAPKSVDFAEVLPRNPSGKLLKRELREPYWKDKDRRIG